MTEKPGFAWNVQKLLSIVPDLVQEVADAAIAEHKSLKPKSPTSKKKAMARKASIEESEPELVTERGVIKGDDNMPKEVIDRVPNIVVPEEDDWEILSEKASNRSFGGDVLVARAGSVRSIDHESSSHTTLSLPFKIQRTASSSTLDSQDNALGPSGKGVLGVDYVEHVVLPTDTLQGVCLSYKVSASHLRRANHFSGNSLHLAPKKLLIPLSKQALRTGFIRVQDTDTKEYKLSYFQAEYPDFSAAEAKAYLELADWELKDALQSAKEDREWEEEEPSTDDLKAGQIGVKINFQGGKTLLNLKGIGRSPNRKSERRAKEAEEKETLESSKVKSKVVVHSAPPAIATKSVLAEDLYKAASQHESFGFELKPIRKRSDGTTSASSSDSD